MTRPPAVVCMARAANVQAFINKHLQQFVQINLATKIPLSVLVAQSALETGWGSSTLYNQGRSLFAFRYYARHEFFVQLSGGKYAGYESYDEAAEDYIWLMTRAESSGMADFREWAGYKAVLRAAAATYSGSSDQDAKANRAFAVCEALGASKFCEGGGYNNDTYGIGGKLKQIIVANALLDLDPAIYTTGGGGGFTPGDPGGGGGGAGGGGGVAGPSAWEDFKAKAAVFFAPAGAALKKVALVVIAAGALYAILGASWRAWTDSKKDSGR